jgi:L-threonylcarbamoyladenylate synthase
MTHIEINPKRIRPAVLDLVAGSLQIGQVVVLPTDTIYGLSCLANLVKPIKQIYRIKKRDAKKPLLILVSDLKMAKKYVAISSVQARFLRKVWAKNQPPITVILKHLNKLPHELARGSDGLAIRLPKSKFLIKIIKKVDCPLVSTSLNLSGEKNINDFSKLNKYFPRKSNRPDLVIDAGRARKRKPSRLIDLRNEDKPIIIRK